jgi:copper chaperone CopZ
MSDLTFYVAGMRCRRCVREVTARLRDVTGVETVTADAGSAQVRLRGSMAVTDVVHALAGTTYRLQITDDSAEDSTANRDGTEPGQRRR